MDTTTINALISGIFLLVATLVTGIFKVRADKLEKKIKKVSETLPSPKLLYEHDEKGNPISGSIDQLIEAVNKGYPIKVKIKQPENIIRLFDAELIAIEKGIVYASNTSQISLKRGDRGIYDFQEKPYRYFVVVSSKGNHNAQRVYFDGKIGHQSKNNWPMAWIGIMPSDQQ